MTCIGPVLVVIDGLECSGYKSARKDILTALAEKGADLPPNFKFLVTCRPEEDICAAFQGKSHVTQKHLEHRADSFVPPPTLRKPQKSKIRSRPPTPPLSIPDFISCNPSFGADSSLSDSTPISGISGSGSAVSAVFDTWDDGSDSTESPPSSASSVDEELQSSKKKDIVQYTRRSQELVTVEHISEAGDRTISRTNSEKFESWTVKQHDHPRSGLLLKEPGFVAEPANDLPSVGCSSRPPRRDRQKQFRAKTIVRHSTNVDAGGNMG
ncbi:hypothetical protein BDR07DRAFT_379460 [Suillus spraguei]|nr:hypothetical protein BDR07DRAFT_379460 [Suillus spraguei]